MEKSELPEIYVMAVDTETIQPQGGCQPSQSRYDGPPSESLGYSLPPTYQSQYQNPSPGCQTEREYPRYPGAPEPPYLQKEYTFRENVRRNRPQSHSLSAATIIFASGGMSLAQSTGAGAESITDFNSEGAYIHMQICWFVAVIIGAIISTGLIQTLTKRTFNFLSASLVTISGIIFVSTSDSVVGIAIARYCNGIGFGLTLVPTILAGSEQSVKRFRGTILSIEQMGLATGITLQMCYATFWQKDWSITLSQMHGISSIFQGTISFILTYFLTLESAVFYLRMDNETEALNALCRLQRPREVTNETYALLYENKCLVEEDTARGRGANVSAGIVPMVKICLFRAFVSMSFSLPLTWAIILATTRNNAQWGPYAYVYLRFFGVFIGVITIDRLGRKFLTSFCLLVGGGLLIAVGVIYTNFAWYPIDSGRLNAIIGLMLAFQFLAGIAAPSSTSYLGEAFSVSVKPFFILGVVFFENVIQIIICCSFGKTLESVGAFGYTVGILQAVFGVILCTTMPETKRVTLREALAMFKKNLYVGRS